MVGRISMSSTASLADETLRQESAQWTCFLYLAATLQRTRQSRCTAQHRAVKQRLRCPRWPDIRGIPAKYPPTGPPSLREHSPRSSHSAYLAPWHLREHFQVVLYASGSSGCPTLGRLSYYHLTKQTTTSGARVPNEEACRERRPGKREQVWVTRRPWGWAPVPVSLPRQRVLLAIAHCAPGAEARIAWMLRSVDRSAKRSSSGPSQVPFRYLVVQRPSTYFHTAHSLTQRCDSTLGPIAEPIKGLLWRLARLGVQLGVAGQCPAGSHQTTPTTPS